MREHQRIGIFIPVNHPVSAVAQLKNGIGTLMQTGGRNSARRISCKGLDGCVCTAGPSGKASLASNARAPIQASQPVLPSLLLIRRKLAHLMLYLWAIQSLTLTNHPHRPCPKGKRAGECPDTRGGLACLPRATSTPNPTQRHQIPLAII